MLAGVVFPLDDRYARAVGANVTLGVVVGFFHDISVFVEFPVDAAIVSLVQRRLPVDAEIPLRNLLLCLVAAGHMLRPAVRVQRAIVLTIQHQLADQVAVFVESLLHLADAVDKHRRIAFVKIAVPQQMLVFVIAPGDRHHAAAVRADAAIRIVVGLPDDVPVCVECAVDAAVAAFEEGRLPVDAVIPLRDLLLVLVIGRVVFAPAVGVRGALAAAVQHGLLDEIAVFIKALLELTDAVDRHGLAVLVQITIPHQSLRLVVFPLDGDDAIAVRTHLAFRVVIRFLDCVPRSVELPIHAAVAVLEQDRIAVDSQIALGDLLLLLVEGRQMFAPVVRVQAAAAAAVVLNLAAYVPVFIEFLLDFPQTVDGHRLAACVKVTIPDDAFAFIIAPLDRDDPVRVRPGFAFRIIVGFLNDIPRFVEFTVDSAVAVLEQDRLAVGAEIALRDLLLLFVPDDPMLAPVVRMQRGIAFAVHHGLMRQVPGFVVGLREFPDALDCHRPALCVQIAIPDQPRAVIIPPFHDCIAFLAGGRTEVFIIEFLANDAPAVVIKQNMTSKALFSGVEMALLVYVFLLGEDLFIRISLLKLP